MSELTEALEIFSLWIENSQSSHAQIIRCNPYIKEYSPKPGLEREMIELYVEEMNIELPEEIYELYQWHDGWFEIGDCSNPLHFVPFEFLFDRFLHCELKRFPIFFGDALHYAIDPVEKGQQFSPIRYSNNSFEQNEYDLTCGIYAPSLTNVIKAVAECIQQHDAISIYHADFSREERNDRSSSMTQIYKKYGVIGLSCGLWK